MELNRQKAGGRNEIKEKRSADFDRAFDPGNDRTIGLVYNVLFAEYRYPDRCNFGGVMSDQTVYIKLSQMTEVYDPDVYLKDIAEIHCIDKNLEVSIKGIRIVSFSKTSKGKKQVETYIGDLMEILDKVEEINKEIQVNSIGESEFVVKYRPNAGGALL